MCKIINITENKELKIETINEILQDSFFFSLLLRIKRSLKEVEAKSYLTMFIKQLSVVYIYELSVCLENYGIIKKDYFYKPNMKKRVKIERQCLHQSIFNSDKITKKILEMGIDLSELVYDLNIVVNDGKLLYTNFEDYNEDKDLEFWNSIFYLNEEVLETIFKALRIDEQSIKILYEKISEKVKDIIPKLENYINGKRYSYSVFKLFSNSKNLEQPDKIFILYRYRLITSIMHIEKIFSSIPIEIHIGDIINLEFKTYLRKYKSLIIDIIGNDLMKINTSNSKIIIDKINKKITNKNFYAVNRKLRNNVHYTNITSLTDDEIQILDYNQNNYLLIITSFFEKSINIDIDDESIMMTNFLKCCREKGMVKEDIDKDYKNLYKKFYFTGNI
ncbi:MAG: hypothetical protein PHG03_06040 [Bacilli bacterium]|nr:hypothetical protein [Bacilli bacterium]